MANVKVIPIEQFGRQFVPPEYLPPNQDEYYLRNEQLGRQRRMAPPARPRNRDPGQERQHLRRLGSVPGGRSVRPAADQELRVLRAGPHRPARTGHAGASRSANAGGHHRQRWSISCDIGENAAIHNVRYLAHYIVGDNAMLLNIDEMHTTNHAKFGNGIVKDGEPEEVRVWIDLINETGTRAVMPFDGMIPADAYLWAKYRDDAALQRKLGEITQRQFDSRRGFYGTVGAQAASSRTARFSRT